MPKPDKAPIMAAAFYFSKSRQGRSLAGLTGYGATADMGLICNDFAWKSYTVHWTGGLTLMIALYRQ